LPEKISSFAVFILVANLHGEKVELKVSEKAIGVILSKLKLPDFAQSQLMWLEL